MSHPGPESVRIVLKHNLPVFDQQIAVAIDSNQRLSDRAVNILRATEVHELLPRVATTPDHFECRWCPRARRCWEMKP